MRSAANFFRHSLCSSINGMNSSMHRAHRLNLSRDFSSISCDCLIDLIFGTIQLNGDGGRWVGIESNSTIGKLLSINLVLNQWFSKMHTEYGLVWSLYLIITRKFAANGSCRPNSLNICRTLTDHQTKRNSDSASGTK